MQKLPKPKVNYRVATTDDTISSPTTKEPGTVAIGCWDNRRQVPAEHPVEFFFKPLVAS